MPPKGRKRKQSNLNPRDEPIQQPPNMSTRTQVGRRVYNQVVDHQQDCSRQIRDHDRVVDHQQDCNQQVQHHDTRRQTNSTFNENTGIFQNHMIDNQAHNSQHEEARQQNMSDHSNGSNEVESGHTETQERGQKARGPTLMAKIWGRPSHLPPIQLEFNRFGIPIGKEAHKFSEFLGTIARSGKYCPIDLENWHKVPHENKMEMLEIAKSKFDLTLADEDWILKSISSKWRSWKHELKTKWFVPNRVEEDLSDERDDRVLKDQWLNILKYWNKDEAKERSEKNKAARSKKLMDHRTGKQSFAQVYDTMEKELGRKPSRAELFGPCFVPKKGTPTSLVSDYLDNIQEKRNQLQDDSSDPIGPDDIFAQVVGQDKPGRVRMVGTGVSPSYVWGKVPNRSMSRRLMMEQKSEVALLRKEVAELRSQQLSQHSLQSNNLSRTTSTQQPLRVGGFVSLMSLFDPTKVVAKGYLHITDPNTEIGGIELGPSWCGVHINVVLQPEEELIRPYGYFKTVGDTLGVMVAWPMRLVTPIQCN